MMLIEGTVIRDCVTRNMPSSLGAPIDKLQKGDTIRINGVERKPEGTWYYVGASGWLKARDFEVTRDIEFAVKAKKMKLLDMQRFSLGSGFGSGLKSITDNSMSIGQVAGIAITGNGGGCFGNPGPVGGLGSIGGVNENTKIGGLASSFGIDLGGGFLGKAVGNSTVGSLFDGSFLGNLLDSAIDSLFGSFFSRLKFVVGFDIEALLGQLYGAWDMGTLEDVLDAIEKTGLAGIWTGWKQESYQGLINETIYDEEWKKSYMASVHYFDYLGCKNMSDGFVVANNIASSSAGVITKTDTFYDVNSQKWKKLEENTVYHLKNGRYWTDAQGIDYTIDTDAILKQQDSDLYPDREGNLKPANYRTPLLESKLVDSEVQFWNSLYENVYDDFTESITKAKTNLDLNIERMDWFVNFNRYRKTHPDYHLTGSQGHVFMTRPALNIFAGNSASEVSEGIKNSSDAAFFAEAIKRHSTIAKSLTPVLSGSHDFIPIIHNTARSIDIQDTAIDTLEYGETLTKWKIMYAKDVIKTLTSGTFSISYVDDNHLSISFLHLIWLYYMNGVSRGEYGPVDQCIKDGILDYASSCYYILTDITGENIIFWSKYWGVFPTNYPSSSFSLKESDMVKTPDITIQYAYSFKRDMDPLILAEFNRNSSAGQDFSYIPIHLKGADMPYGTMVGPPFIEYYTGEDGSASYKLRFRKAPDDGSGGSVGNFSSSGNTNWLQAGAAIASSFI